MYRLFFIAKNNLKKKKSDVFVLMCLVTLATMLLYISMTVLTNTNNVIDKAYDKYNTADYLYVAYGTSPEKYEKVFRVQEEVTELESAFLVNNVEGKYRGEKEKEEEQFVFCIGAIEEERNISKVPTENMEERKKNSIILPYYLQVTKSYEIGEAFYLTIGETEYEFEIMGFVEDPMFSAPTNIGTYRIYISQEYMGELLKNEKLEFYQGYEFKMKLNGSPDEIEKKYLSILRSEIGNTGDNFGLSWESMKNGVSLMSNIGMGIILVFAVLLVVIAMIIIRFSVRNFIEENLRNIGILQASGYTAKELILSSLFEMLMIIVTGEVLGLILGFACGGFIGNIESLMMGLTWNQGFDVKCAGITVVSILVITLCITVLSARIYGKISVLEALRGGIHTHNFKKNHLPLEKTHQPLAFALGEKSILREKLKSISIFGIVTILSMASCMGFFLYSNFVTDNKALLKLVGLEITDVLVQGENLEKIGREIEAWEEVEWVKYYKFVNITIEKGDKKTTIACDSWENTEILENEMLIKGRVPKYENEIVVTSKVSEILDIQVGDVVYVTGEGETLDYIVVGIDQKINNMGRKALLSFEGEDRLNGATEISNIYIDGKEGYGYKELNEKIASYYPEVSDIDYRKTAESSMESIIMAMKMICVVFVVITVVVVFLVVMLLIKSKVIREWKNYGLYKAIGYTTGQLIMQTVMSNLPIMFLGAVAGGILSIYAINPVCSICLAMVGIKKSELTVQAGWIFVTVIGITLLSFVVAVLYSYKVRKLEPVKMLAEE
ncbi:MAG: ABC transporter permease [Lachnospiraceae bacterium]|nr:ABC transporter permease [Lachnospiraceae bacterium]